VDKYLVIVLKKYKLYLKIFFDVKILIEGIYKFKEIKYIITKKYFFV